MRYSIAALALAGAMASSLVALAQESADAPADVDAAALFREAEARYVAGDVAGALEAMERSYTLSGRAELLFNLGELRRELGRCADARRDYEAYLERVTEGARRESARTALEALRTECPDAARVAPESASSEAPVVAPAIVHQRASVPAPPWSSPPASESGASVRPLTIAGWSAVGVSVLAGVGATIFAIQAANHESRLEARIKEIRATPNGGGFSSADRELEVDGQRAATWAQVLGVGAASFAALGVSFLVFGGNTVETQRASVSIQWCGDGVRAAYGHPF